MFSLTVNDTLLIRSYQEEDAPAHFAVVQENREHLRPWLGWVDTHTKEIHSLEYIQSTLQKIEFQEAMALAIFEHQQFVGAVGMHCWDHELKKAELGYWLSKKAEGRGIIHICLKHFIHYIFQHLSINKLEIRYITKNIRSEKVAAQLGFKKEGILRDSYFLNGSLHDLVVTGMLAREW